MTDDNIRILQELRARTRFAALSRDEQASVYLGLATAAALNGDDGCARDSAKNEYFVKDFHGFEFEGSRLP